MNMNIQEQENQLNLSGKLIYNHNADYELHSTGGMIYNISSLLRKVYYAEDNYIDIKIMNNCNLIFNENGNLYMKVIKRPKLSSYFILGEDLGSTLFNAVGLDLEITILAGALRGDNIHEKISSKT